MLSRFHVSILVLVDVPLKQESNIRFFTMCAFVSILVLVDVPLKLLCGKLICGDLFRFNPCFGGCSIKTQGQGKHLSHRLRFNPCFGGCSIKTTRALCIFQSVSRFNPCFGGCSIKTPITFSFSLRNLLFQSLFWWMFH